MDKLNSYNLSNGGELDDSVLGRIVSDNRSKEISSVLPSKIINNVLNRLKDRDKDVLVSRYGLHSTEATNKETLESIGNRLSVTRERVRQIEKALLKKITKKYAPAFKSIWGVIDEYILKYGGLVALDDLAKYLKLNEGSNVDYEVNALRLVMSVHPRLKPLGRSALLKEGWVLKDSISMDKLVDLQNELIKTLKEDKKPLPEDRLVEMVVKKMEVDKNLIRGALRVGAELGMDNKRQWGLSSWSIIVPKRIRDKVYIVLEEVGRPLHFEDITKLTQEKFKSKKNILSRTVHNELISDKRFVLVGRGIYALKSWGYKPGVVSDVIKEVLEQSDKPMHVSEITEAVLKRRQVKRNTIIANLQNRDLFKKVGKATYALADVEK